MPNLDKTLTEESMSDDEAEGSDKAGPPRKAYHGHKRRMQPVVHTPARWHRLPQAGKRRSEAAAMRSNAAFDINGSTKRGMGSPGNLASAGPDRSRSQLFFQMFFVLLKESAFALDHFRPDIAARGYSHHNACDAFNKKGGELCDGNAGLTHKPSDADTGA